MFNKNIKISVVTVTYNSEATLKRCIESVLNQTYKNIEYIIIDGLSEDNTLKIIEEYAKKHSNMKYLSEKDKGIYDAMNKGIKMCNGELIGLLNSDDWYDLSAIEILVRNFDDSVDIFHGNIYLVKNEGDKRYYRVLKKVKTDLKKQMLNHPATFVTKKWYEKMKYDTKYKISADYKFMLQSEILGAKFKYIDYLFTYFSIYGASSNIVKSAYEDLKIKKELGIISAIDIFNSTKAIIRSFYYYTRKAVAKLLLPNKIYNKMSISKWKELK